MDANDTRYHLLLGYENWARAQARDAAGDLVVLDRAWEQDRMESANTTELEWDGERYELILAPRLFQFVAAPKDRRLLPEDRRGAARDAYGNWYWIDPSRRKVRVASVGSGVVSDFWPLDSQPCPPRSETPGSFQPLHVPSTPAPQEFAGLAVTELHYLVVGVIDPPGLLVFDLHAGGPPEHIYWPPQVDFTPFDMAAMPGGGVWILDRENCRYWALDSHFNVMRQGQELLTLVPEQEDTFVRIVPNSSGTITPPGWGEEVQRTAAHTFPSGIELNAASPLAARDPVAIEGLPDCTVLILDSPDGEPFAEVYRYRFAEQLGEPATTAGMSSFVEEDRQADFILPGHDFAFVQAHSVSELGGMPDWDAADAADGEIADRLVIVPPGGNQAFVFHICTREGQLELEPLAGVYLPIRLFSGKALFAAPAVVGSGQETWRVYYDLGESWLPLVAQRRPRYAEQAELETPVFDGRQPGCTWHRLMLDGCLPPETEAQVWSRTTDSLEELEWAIWNREPRFYLRGDGPELPFAIGDRAQQQRELLQGKGTWELLFQRARGRYLQLRLRLEGNGQRTPRLRALRLYYPRFSYSEHYLPGIYQADPEPASFLERFLANLEGFYTVLEDKIVGVRQLFDVASAPAEALEWLASWFGAALDPSWDEATRRLFIEHAMELFQFRGTRRGLEMVLRLSLNPCPDESIFDDDQGCLPSPGSIRIEEIFRSRQAPGLLTGVPTPLQWDCPNIPPPEGYWSPDRGSEDLNRRYRQYRQQRGLDTPGGLRYPIRQPGGADADPWAAFSTQALGFIPAATPADKPTWQAFLARRYGRVEALWSAYSLGETNRMASFSEAELPTGLPADGPALVDWYHFEAVVLPLKAGAHRFSVLLPMSAGVGPNSPEYRRRLGLAQRLVDLEKPAHTAYNVRFYWALFRLGEARLGWDTQIEQGGRAPQLLTPLVLDGSYLSESYLTSRRPPDLPGRLVLNR